MQGKRARKPTREPEFKTFAALFPASGKFKLKNGNLGWRIRGSGVNGPCEEAGATRAVTALLEANGIRVDRSGMGGFCNADMFTLKASFLDGGLSGTTGNYLFQPKNASIRGVRAALFVALGLKLKVPRRFLEEHSLTEVTFDQLKAELIGVQPAIGAL